jgi:putative tryptophan/tyrosine transport system substrate-binding protein
MATRPVRVVTPNKALERPGMNRGDEGDSRRAGRSAPSRSPHRENTQLFKGLVRDCQVWIGATSRRATTFIAVFIVLLAPAVLAVSLAADAQEAGKLHRIGVLRISPELSWMEAFRKGLSDLGYVEGQQIAILDRLAEEKVDRLVELAAELVRLKVDVIVTAGPISTRAAKQATSTIPIVMAADDNPVEDGFVASLGRPGGNTTGLTILSPELSGKRLALLKETIPKVSRVAVLSNPANRSYGPAVSATKAAALSMGLQLEAIAVRGPEEFESAFSAMSKSRIQALVLGHRDPIFHVHAKRITGLALKGRLPAIFYLKDFAVQGGLMSYAPSYTDLFRRAAVYVDKILKGTKPGDLPVEQPTKFELVINLKTAKALDLTIPQSILLRADEVIQ